MVSLMICALLLAALWTAWIVLAVDQDRELTPEPVRVRTDEYRRR